MKVRFYSKSAIGIWTSLLTPFLGCILFAYNLREVGKGKAAPILVIIGIVWMVIMKKILGQFIQIDLVQLLISNVISAVILTTVVWDRFLGEYTYEVKSPWKPVLVFFSICAALLLLQIFLVRK